MVLSLPWRTIFVGEIFVALEWGVLKRKYLEYNLSSLKGLVYMLASKTKDSPARTFHMAWLHWWTKVHAQYILQVHHTSLHFTPFLNSFLSFSFSHCILFLFQSTMSSTSITKIDVSPKLPGPPQNAEPKTPLSDKEWANSEKSKVLIVGAGIGSFLLGNLLQKANVPFLIVEKAREVKPLGMWPQFKMFNVLSMHVDRTLISIPRTS